MHGKFCVFDGSYLRDQQSAIFHLVSDMLLFFGLCFFFKKNIIQHKVLLGKISGLFRSTYAAVGTFFSPENSLERAPRNSPCITAPTMMQGNLLKLSLVKNNLF